MDIQLIMCDNDGESRSLNFFRNECLDLFINDQTMGIEVDPTKLVRPKDKLQHLALKELEKEGVLVEYSGQTGTLTYFLRDEIWNYKKTFTLSLDSLSSAAYLYNTVMPSLIKDVGLFRPLNPLDIDAPVLEALISVLNLTFSTDVPLHITEPSDEEGGDDNTFSLT